MRIGIQNLHVYAGSASLDVGELARARDLDLQRFDNLMLDRKTVALPFEDPVSFAVNAARPIVAALGPEEKSRIELLLVATESGLDFGKPISTYIHHHLGLSRHCRNLEVKHACYGGTGSLQMALCFVRSNVSPGATALVVTTDVARPNPFTYAEPSQGAAAVAMLVGPEPRVLELEAGAAGYYGYEVMDSCRPTPEIETGDADLSLLTYLDCLEHSFADYRRRVGPVGFRDHFRYLAFHAPFGGLAKGAHRALARKLERMPPQAIEEDFQSRMAPSLSYCRQVGNVYSGSVFMALAGLIEQTERRNPERVGLFSYGSGCCSEFYSGLLFPSPIPPGPEAPLEKALKARHSLTMDEYERLIPLNRGALFGTENGVPDTTTFAHVYDGHFAGRGLLVLDRIEGYHRKYRWT